jgi:hypothetical protein
MATYTEDDIIHADFIWPAVDSTDAAWCRRHLKHTGRRAGGKRHAFCNEVYYSMSSCLKHMPWHRGRKILVTDGQKIRVPEGVITIDHKDFIPHEYLPTFQSDCIELWFHKIPGVSRAFVAWNDDLFINAPVEPGFFLRKSKLAVYTDGNMSQQFYLYKHVRRLYPRWVSKGAHVPRARSVEVMETIHDKHPADIDVCCRGKMRGTHVLNVSSFIPAAAGPDHMVRIIKKHRRHSLIYMSYGRLRARMANGDLTAPKCHILCVNDFNGSARDTYTTFLNNHFI